MDRARKMENAGGMKRASGFEELIKDLESKEVEEKSVSREAGELLSAKAKAPRTMEERLRGLEEKFDALARRINELSTEADECRAIENRLLCAGWKCGKLEDVLRALNRQQAGKMTNERQTYDQEAQRVSYGQYDRA